MSRRLERLLLIGLIVATGVMDSWAELDAGPRWIDQPDQLTGGVIAAVTSADGIETAWEWQPVENGAGKWVFTRGGFPIAQSETWKPPGAAAPGKLLISLAAAMPLSSNPDYWQFPVWAELRNLNAVIYDGEPLVLAESLTEPSEASGGRASNAITRGWLEGDRLDDQWRWSIDPAFATRQNLPVGWPATIRVELNTSLPPGPGRWPLVSVDEQVGGDVVWLVRDEVSTWRLELLRHGELVSRSDALPWKEGRQTCELSLGAFWPADAPSTKTPLTLIAWKRWRGRAWARWNGDWVWDAEVDFSTFDPPQLAWGRNWNVIEGSIRYLPGWGHVAPGPSIDDLLEVLADRESQVPLRGGGWGEWPGPLTLSFTTPVGVTGVIEPLLSTGITGAGDFVIIKYEDTDTILIGFDHWGVGGPWSDPIKIDPTLSQDLTISLGNLWPPLDDPLYEDHPEWVEMKDRVVIWLNGARVLDGPLQTHPITPATIVPWANLIGGSSSIMRFSGRRINVRLAPLAGVAPKSD